MDDNGTRSSPVFEHIATDLVRVLESYRDPEAREMLSHARRLVAVFQCWANQRPQADERISVINELLSLHRTAMEFHTSHPPPSVSAP